MKKLLFIVTIWILSLSFVLSSCDNGTREEQNGNQESISNVTADSSETTDDNSQKPTEEPTEESTKGATDDPHVHAYGAWVTVTEANCQHTGKKERTCSCGNKETKTLAKLDHNYVNNVCTMCKQKDPNAFVPDYQAGEANVVGSDDSDLNYTAQGGYIYFSDENKIQKIKKEDGTVEPVYDASAGTVFNVNVVGDWVYFYCQGSTMAKSYIAKVRTDGSGFEKLVVSLSVFEMLVVKDIIYYTTMTQDWTYVDYSKDILPLYSVSVNGGAPKQIHDGAVRDITADATYLYFIHDDEMGNETICRIKHASNSKSILFKNTLTVGFSLENSKLYFLVIDDYDLNVTLASISINGGSYTTYGKLCLESAFCVVGSKAYFMGAAPFSEENPEPEFGFMEYDMNTKRFKQISEDHYGKMFVSVFGTLIFESYDYDAEKLEYIEIYNPSTGVFKKIDLS